MGEGDVVDEEGDVSLLCDAGKQAGLDERGGEEG